MAPLTNSMHVPSAAAPNGLPTGSKLLRRIALGLGVVIALIAGLALAGAGYEAIAARRDAQAYPVPGQLVDVGGYNLHIQCVGTGSPTVVLDAGLGGTSLDWNLVQSQIGQTTRVCAKIQSCLSCGKHNKHKLSSYRSVRGMRSTGRRGGA